MLSVVGSSVEQLEARDSAKLHVNRQNLEEEIKNYQGDFLVLIFNF